MGNAVPIFTPGIAESPQSIGNKDKAESNISPLYLAAVEIWELSVYQIHLPVAQATASKLFYTVCARTQIPVITQNNGEGVDGLRENIFIVVRY